MQGLRHESLRLFFAVNSFHFHGSTGSLNRQMHQFIALIGRRAGSAMARVTLALDAHEMFPSRDTVSEARLVEAEIRLALCELRALVIQYPRCETVLEMPLAGNIGTIEVDLKDLASWSSMIDRIRDLPSSGIAYSNASVADTLEERRDALEQAQQASRLMSDAKVAYVRDLGGKRRRRSSWSQGEQT